MLRQPQHTFDKEMYDLEQEETEYKRNPTMIEQGTMSLAYIYQRLKLTETATKIGDRIKRFLDPFAIVMGMTASQLDDLFPTPYNH